MLIYFHIDELSRDAIVASGLEKKLKLKGGRLFFGNRSFLKFLKYINFFDFIILPSIDHYMLAFPSKDSLPNNVMILPAEAVGQATGHLRRINAKYFGTNSDQCKPWHQSVCHYLLWGFAHLKPFEELFPEYLNKCSVVGHPRLDDICFRSNYRSNRVKEKKIVGFVSRFSLLNPFDGRSNFSSIYQGMKNENIISAKFENSPEHDIEDLLYTEAIDLRLFFLIFSKLSPSDFEIFIRPHPRENRVAWRKLIEQAAINAKVCDWSEPFGWWLQSLDFVIAPPSTSFYDVLFQGMTPICIDGIVPKRRSHILVESDDNNQILSYVYRPETIKELIESIEKDLVPEPLSEADVVLEGQIAKSIAREAIGNIVGIILDRSSAAESDRNKVAARFKFEATRFLFLGYSSLHYFFNRIKKGAEQGSTFSLTSRRLSMIRRMTYKK